ncbi:MAG: CHAP domain-containing protein [Dongiaceae bacterium]
MRLGPEIARHRRRWTVGRLAALLLIAGCATPKPPPAVVSAPIRPEPPLSSLQSYAVKPGIGTQCVPYARARSGIGIFGDAYTWWDTAAGHYARGNRPFVGSVLVLRKTSRLQRGHLGVVSAIVGPREIHIDHANWQPDKIITNMAVIDVSPANDWTKLRFWNKKARTWGSIYPAAGFIYNLPDGAIPPSGIGTTVISSGGDAEYGPPEQSAR